MQEMVPPWARPAGTEHRRQRARPGDTRLRCFWQSTGNRATQSYGAAAAFAAMLAGLQLANHEKSWDAKPKKGAKAQPAAPGQPGCRILCIRN